MRRARSGDAARGVQQGWHDAAREREMTMMQAIAEHFRALANANALVETASREPDGQMFLLKDGKASYAPLYKDAP